MHFSTRAKMSRPLSLLVIAILVGAAVLGGVFLRSTTTHATSLVQQSAIKGTMAPAGIAVLTGAAKNATPRTFSKPPAKGVRSTHTGVKASAAHQINAATTPFDQAGKLLRNFNGVSSLDSAVTNFGAEFEPPDQGLCEGNGFIVEPVNSAFTIYHRNGSVVLGPLNVNVLFDEGLTTFTSDPRCYFDQPTHTWIATILFINGNNAEAHTDIAVNHSGDPTTPWTVYHLEGTDDGTSGTPNHAGCPCFGDQPLLGLDQENVYVSTNEFSILGPAFNGAQVYAISKAQLFGLSNHVHFVQFDNLNIGGAIATSIQPAITYGHSNAEYFLNSLDPFGTFDNRIGVWAMTNEQNVSQGKVPSLSHMLITSEPYGVPPKAIQQGSTSLLDSGDDRMMQVQFIDGNLWGALTTAVTIPNDTAPRAGIAWFKVQPHLDNNAIGSANLKDQGYVASLGNYAIYPSIEANHDGAAAIVMTLTGPNFFPSVAYTVLQESKSKFGPIKIAAPGTGPYDPAATRWGDYSAATFDPTLNAFWMAGEYIPPVASQTTDGARNWGTRVIEVNANS